MSYFGYPMSNLDRKSEGPNGCNPTTEVWKMMFLSKWVIFRFHFSFGGNILSVCTKKNFHPESICSGNSCQKSQQIHVHLWLSLCIGEIYTPKTNGWKMKKAPWKRKNIDTNHQFLGSKCECFFFGKFIAPKTDSRNPSNFRNG